MAGHAGMVGSAIMRRLETLGYDDIVTASRAQLDLLDANAVEKFFQRQSPRADLYSRCPSWRHLGK